MSLNILSCDVVEDEVEVGSNYTVEVQIENTGDTAREVEVEVWEDRAVVDQYTVGTIQAQRFSTFQIEVPAEETANGITVLTRISGSSPA